MVNIVFLALFATVCIHAGEYNDYFFSFFIEIWLFSFITSFDSKIIYNIYSFLFTSDILHGKFFKYAMSEDTDLVYGNFELCEQYCPKGTEGGFRRLH